MTVSPAVRFSAAGFLFAFATALTLLAFNQRTFTPWPEARPILERHADLLPAALKNANASKFLAWSRSEDKAIRARLEQGDLDSMVNLLLYGTSFTRQPRIGMAHLTEAAKSGTLHARVDDLVAGLRDPGGNERLLVLQQLLRKQGIDPANPDAAQDTGKFIYTNLLRVVKEREALAGRAAKDRQLPHPDDAASLLDRSSLFADRGVSLDTGIFPDYSIEQTLRDLKRRGLLREGQTSRIAVIGPGLDFIDKNEDSAFDYYPRQTVQPFALYDSLLRLKLATPGALSESVFDISPEVLGHLQRARRANAPSYTIQLPQSISGVWPPGVVDYWKSFGDQIGSPAAPIPPPRIFPGLTTRAVRIRPGVVRACEPVDLDIILERLNLPAAERYDLIVATNIFVYYDAFEQSLALENAGAMLKPGGLLLTNDRLPAVPGESMQLAGVTIVPFGPTAREAVGWYRKTE